MDVKDKETEVRIRLNGFFWATTAIKNNYYLLIIGCWILIV
jgi:hypothetical protein